MTEQEKSTQPLKEKGNSVSLIAAVLNERGNIHSFLDGLLSQTLTGHETILCDGGSTDGTVEVIHEYMGRGAPIQLIRAPGANIARGRNLAIARARGEIVACTDTGCRVHSDWLAEIVAPFRSPGTDVACGLSRAEARSGREKSFAILMLNDPEKADIRTFSPSSRSVAFRRTFWEKVGGYPEELYCAEDSLFNQRLRQAGAGFVLCPRAVVFWRPPSSMFEAARKYFHYGVGDGRARLHRGICLRIAAKISGVLLLALPALTRPAFGWALALCAAAYYLRTLLVNRHRGSAAVTSLLFFHRILLDPVRLIGYLFGRLRGPRIG